MPWPAFRHTATAALAAALLWAAPLPSSQLPAGAASWLGSLEQEPTPTATPFESEILHLPLVGRSHRLYENEIRPGTVNRLGIAERWQIDGFIESVTFSHDSSVFVWGGLEGITLYDLQARRILRNLPGHWKQTQHVEFTPSDRLLLSGGVDEGGGRIRAWDWAAGTEVWSAVAAPPQWGVVFGVSPDGEWLVTAAARRITQWALREDGLGEHALLGAGGGTPAISPLGMIAYWENGVLLKHVERPDWLHIPAPSSGCDASDLAFSPDGALVAAGAWDGIARIWRTEDGELAHALVGHRGWVWTVAFSANGRVLATGSADGTVRLWSVRDGHALRTIDVHRAAVTTLAFSADGRWLAVGGGSTVQLWGISQ